MIRTTTLALAVCTAVISTGPASTQANAQGAATCLRAVWILVGGTPILVSQVGGMFVRAPAYCATCEAGGIPSSQCPSHMERGPRVAQPNYILPTYRGVDGRTHTVNPWVPARDPRTPPSYSSDYVRQAARNYLNWVRTNGSPSSAPSAPRPTTAPVARPLPSPTVRPPSMPNTRVGSVHTPRPGIIRDPAPIIRSGPAARPPCAHHKRSGARCPPRPAGGQHPGAHSLRQCRVSGDGAECQPGGGPPPLTSAAQ